MSDNFKKIADLAGPGADDTDEQDHLFVMPEVSTDSSNLFFHVPMQQSQAEDDGPKCKLCKQSLKESADVMKSMPGMWGNKVGGACAFCLFGLKYG